MDDHRQAQLRRKLQLGAERPFLIGAGREIAVEIEADLPDGDDARRVRKLSQQAERVGVERLRFVGVEGDGGVDVGVARGEGDRLPAAPAVDADDDVSRYARFPRPLEHGVAVPVEGRELKVAVGIENGVHLTQAGLPPPRPVAPAS